MKNKTTFFISLVFFCSAISNSLNCQNNGLVDTRYGEQIITVGGPEADVSGFTSGAIQLALDALKTRGGGVVSLSAGVFNIIGPVRIPDNTTLSGSGKSTILKKCDGFKTSFIIDADWGMLKAVVKDASGFKKGMGIQLFDDEHISGWDVTTAVITEIIDNVIYFDNNTNNDYISSLNGIVSNACSIVEAVGVENARISNLVIEGNKESNDYINGCRGGGVYVPQIKKLPC